MRTTKNLNMWVVMAVFLLGMVCTAAGETIYVDADASGVNNGSSWADAYNYLQDALVAATSGDQIWVAEGTYKPDQGGGKTAGDRTATFQLINGVALYGGFGGGGGQWDDRDPNAYETILSGDLNGNDIDVANPEDLLDEPTRAENSYHVVTGSWTDATAMLDGFTITAGNTSSSYPHSSGAGMYNDNGNPMVTNCTFSGNSAVDGGGMFNYKGSNPTLTNCTFSRNSAMHGGGGMRNEYSSPTVTNCTFSGNSAGYAGAMYNEYSSPTLTDCTFSGNSANDGGGMYNTLYSNPTVTNCTFSGNAATYIHGAGGGMYNSWYSKPTVTNCTFTGNSAPWWGGGMYNYEGSPTVTNCTFIGNEAGMGGGMFNDRNSKPTVTNCTFSGNPADYGGGMCNTRYSKPTMTNSTFSGNSASVFGGGMYNGFYSSPVVTNCVFSGNSADEGGGMYNDFYNSPTLTNCVFNANSAHNGGGMYNDFYSSPAVTNCVFSGNSANWNGGGMRNYYGSSPTLTNCILWGNSAPSGSEIDNDERSSATVSYSDVQGGWPGVGNIKVDPLFADPNNGEYHLKSEGGRWDPNGETWVMDDVTSPCIDRGDSATDYSREPSPNGHRINMGAYGNTPEASKSPSLSETSSAESALVETVMGQQAVLENVTVTGDFNSVLNFTNFDIVTITTGPWAGKGFSKGQWQTILDGIPYTGDWNGALFLKPEERKIYLKGAISGEIFATVEGYLSEFVPESGVYDQYQATWKIGHLGTTTTSATLNLNGNLSYQSSSEFPATELYILQTNVEGTVSGDYAGPLSAVINHVRIVGGNNPYYGEGFSIISYVSGSGSGQGWTYDKLISLGTVVLKGLFTSPLFGIVSGVLNEGEVPRTLSLTVERVDLGLPPAPDPKVEIWGPRRVSPGQTISFVIELRNDGLAEGKNYSVITKLPEHSKFTYATEGYKFYSIADWDENDNYRPVPVVRRDISVMLAKTYLNLAAQTELFFGVTIPQRAEVYILPKERADEIFPVYDPEGAKGDDGISGNDSSDAQERPIIAIGWPIELAEGESARTTEHYGERIHPVTNQPDFHAGIDIGRRIIDDKFVDTYILPAADGFVKDVYEGADIDADGLLDPHPIAGWHIEIDHGGGVTTRYLHLKERPAFNVGDPIWRGIRIAEMGATGRGTGVHLEFQVRKNATAGVAQTGTTVDPELWLFNRQNVQPDLDDNSITDSTAGIDFVTAHDPSIKYGPEGSVSAGERLDYKVEYENEGEGIAFGVYFTDTLDEDLDDSTLEIGLVIDVNDGSIVGEPGIYNPATRTITWFAGEVGPNEGGFAVFDVNVRSDALEGTEIINFATIYFPSVPEETRTNGIVSIVSLNQPPVANAGPDQTVERTSIDGAQVQLDGSDSNDPDGDALTYEWTWEGGSAVGVNPTVILPPGLTTVTLTVSDGQLSDTDTVDINVVDTTPPEVAVIVPQAGAAVQDGVTLTAEAIDASGVDAVYFYIREPNDGTGIPIGYEGLVGTLNTASGKWEYGFDTTQLPDGYYVILAKAIDSYGNEGWSDIVQFSIRNWAVIELLPASESNKAGRTMPVKFSLRIVESVDPAMPFVYNEGLEIRIYDAAEPANILQTSLYGDTSRDYRIDMDGELYITNFKTKKEPAEYVVEIWRTSKNFLVGSFTFETVK